MGAEYVEIDDVPRALLPLQCAVEFSFFRFLQIHTVFVHSYSQPGLQRMVLRLEDLIRRIDLDLHKRFESEGIQYMQFSFRW
jgi:Rab-GTPase-TBC domain